MGDLEQTLSPSLGHIRNAQCQEIFDRILFEYSPLKAHAHHTTYPARNANQSINQSISPEVNQWVNSRMATC